MNGRLFRRQVVCNVLSVRMLAVVLVSCALIAIQWWTTHHAGFIVPESAPNFLSEVMLFSQFGTGSGLYLFLLPFLASLLGGVVVSAERHSGRLQTVLAREGRARFLGTSMVSGFVLGGLAGVLPLLMNLLGAVIMVPHLSFIDGVESNAQGVVYSGKYILVSSMSWAYPLYEFNQILFIAVMTLLVFVFSGLFALVAVGASLFTKRRYVELLVPFALSLAWWMMPALTGYRVPDQWSHIIFLMFATGDSTVFQMMQNYAGMALTAVGCLALVTVMVVVERRRDVV